MNNEWDFEDEFSLDLRVRYTDSPDVSADMVTLEPNCGSGTSRTSACTDTLSGCC